MTKTMQKEALVGAALKGGAAAVKAAPQIWNAAKLAALGAAGLFTWNATKAGSDVLEVSGKNHARAVGAGAAILGTKGGRELAGKAWDTAKYGLLAIPIIAGVSLAVAKRRAKNVSNADLDVIQNNIQIAELEEGLASARRQAELSKLKKGALKDAQRSGKDAREIHI
jgi:hypothetical protein